MHKRVFYNVEHAIRYGKRGWRVHPLEPREKKPLVKAWQNQATTDEHKICEWFTKWPDANVGVATGKESDIFVIDIDGPDGERSWTQLQQEIPEIPEETLEQKTGRGRQLFYKYPPKRELRNKQNLLAGIDVRAEGGYVVVPPSIHPNGATYTWPYGAEVRIESAPSKLLNLISAGRKPDDVDQKPKSDFVPPWSRKAKKGAKAGPDENQGNREQSYLQAALKEEGAAVAATPQGSRNARLNEAAFKLSQLIDAGLSESDIVAALLAASQVCGLPEAEARKTIASGISAGRKQPRGVPEQEAPPNVDVSGFIEKAKQTGVCGGSVHTNAAWASFPIDCFPPRVITLIRSVSAAHNVDESFVALPILGVASAALGNAFRLELKAGYRVPPTLWCGIVGETGANKSGPIWSVVAPMWDQPQADPAKESLVSGAQPQWVIANATTEAVLSRLALCHRGLLMSADEMAEWLRSFDAYRRGKGGDTQIWIKMWDVKTYAVDRKTDDERNVLRAPAVSVVGGIQPTILAECTDVEKLASGFFARAILAMPPPRLQSWTEEGVSQACFDFWRQTVDAMRTQSFAELNTNTGQFEPNIVSLSPEAKYDIWVPQYNSIKERRHRTIGVEKILCGKCTDQIARTALCLYGLECATGEGRWCEPISAKTMEAAVKIGLWGLNETLRVFESVCGEARDDRRANLCRKIAKKGGRTTVRDLQRSDDRFKGKGGADRARDCLRDLEHAGLGKLSGDKFTLKQGAE